MVMVQVLLVVMEQRQHPRVAAAMQYPSHSYTYYRGDCTYSIKGYDRENSNSMIGQKGKGKGKTWSIMWSTQLPARRNHALDSTTIRLCVRDYLRFPRVCFSWRQAANAIRHQKSHGLRTPSIVFLSKSMEDTQHNGSLL